MAKKLVAAIAAKTEVARTSAAERRQRYRQRRRGGLRLLSPKEQAKMRGP